MDNVSGMTHAAAEETSCVRRASFSQLLRLEAGCGRLRASRIGSANSWGGVEGARQDLILPSMFRSVEGARQDLIVPSVSRSVESCMPFGITRSEVPGRDRGWTPHRRTASRGEVAGLTTSLVSVERAEVGGVLVDEQVSRLGRRRRQEARH
eukprot:scaffold26523_cov63-Phaeocystis_antarctica.AAC.5